MSPYMIKRLVGLATVVATVVLVCLVTVVIVQCVQLSNLKAQSNALSVSIERLSSSRANLEQGIEERNTEEYVEQQARDNLGLIKDGEIVYIFE